MEVMQVVRQLFGGTIDFVAVLLFIAIGIVYFLTPVVGYRADRRGGMTMALWLLVAFGGVAFIELVVNFILVLEGDGPVRADRMVKGSGDIGLYLIFMFGIVKVGLFVLAMGMFVNGLKGLRPRVAPEQDRMD
jgi:hypothetical protein